MKTIYLEHGTFWADVVMWFFFKILLKKWNHLESYRSGYLDEFTEAYSSRTEVGRFTESYSSELESEWSVKIPGVIKFTVWQD